MSRAILLPLFAATAVVAGVPVTFSQGSPAKADEVNKNFNYLDSAVGKKASQASLDAVAEALKSKADASALSGKAEQTYVDTKLSAKADTSKVRELSNALAGKADSSALNTLRRKQSADSSTLAKSIQPVDKITSVSGARILGNGIDPNQLRDLESGSSGGSGINQPWDWAVYQSLAPYNGGSLQLAGRHCANCGNRFALRSKDDNTASSKWSDWYELWHKGNFDPAMYLNIAGGTLSGSLLIRDGLGIELAQEFPKKNYAALTFLGFSGITGAANWGLRGPYQWPNGIGNGTDGGDLDLIKSIDGTIALATSINGAALGNVGIGTTTPSARLEVNGDAKVSGDLTVAGSVKTTAGTIKSSDVADYVFEPDYKLMPLAEVEAFTKANKHLPEVPSAAEIEKSGLDLAKMNLLLLKKVEELTLHTIELEKRLKAVEAKD